MTRRRFNVSNDVGVPAAELALAEEIAAAGAAAERDFQALDLAGKRVALAADVLTLLDAEVFQARHNSYCEIAPRADSVVGCTACALGSLLLAYLDRVPTARSRVGDFNGSVERQREIRDLLSPIFGDQLGIIETAFDGMAHINGFGSRTHKAAVAFADEHDDQQPRQHLRAIMRNIIDNNGEFLL